MDKELHIVTHDVPWPADFGGVVDLFYKLTALHTLGCKIHLHCFTSKREEQPELLKYCASVNYYPRKRSGAISGLPYIVSSRSDKYLLAALSKDKHPVLLEGIHCTYFLHAGDLADRKVFLRLHNVEFEYYHQLALHEKNFFKRLYYRRESGLLKKYEAIVATKLPIWTVSEYDKDMYQREFGAKDIHFLPVFLPWNKVSSFPGIGEYCLYHGNLSINENEAAVLWLVENIFNEINIPLVIAGKDPGKAILAQAVNPNIRVIANPSEKEMQELISNAHINLLPSLNNTGVKLKLLNALFNGRHCLVNTAGVQGSGVEDICITADHSNDFKDQLLQLMKEAFTQQEIDRRSELLLSLYNNERNAQQVMTWIY